MNVFKKLKSGGELSYALKIVVCSKLDGIIHNLNSKNDAKFKEIISELKLIYNELDEICFDLKEGNFVSPRDSLILVNKKILGILGNKKILDENISLEIRFIESNLNDLNNVIIKKIKK